jgi:hypothetical protein
MLLDPNDVVGELLTGRDILLELLCDFDIVDVADNDRVLIREMLGEALTESDGVKLNPKELLRDGLASFDGDIVIDLDFVLEIVMDFDID